MKKRHLQNCLSKEKKTFESNVKKYKRLIEKERERENSVKSEGPKILESFTIKNEIVFSDPEASTSESENENEDTESGPKPSPLVESNSNSEGNIVSKCVEIKSWVVRNKISLTALEDLLGTLNRVGVKDLPLSAKTLLSTCRETIQISTIPSGEFLYAGMPNMFENSIEGNVEEVNAIQSIMPKKLDLEDGSEPLPELSTTFLPKNDAKNEDMLEILKKLLENQSEFIARLDKLEGNQMHIMHNQNVLSNGQSSIVAKEQIIANTLEKIEANIVSKPEMMAQSKLMMECKVAIKNVENSVSRMTGETQDSNLDEVASMLPFQTIEVVQEVEQKLGTPEFAQAMTTYLYRLKGTSEDVSSVIRAIFTDNLLGQYNWDGRWEKQSLVKLNLFNKILRDVFLLQGAMEFEQSVKKAVKQSHHRLKQKLYLKKYK